MFSTLDEAFELPAPAAAPKAPTGPAPQAPLTYRLALYKPGSPVVWQGRDMTVSHVLLRRGHLMVYLEGHPDAVEPDTITMPLTRLVLQRS